MNDEPARILTVRPCVVRAYLHHALDVVQLTRVLLSEQVDGDCATGMDILELSAVHLREVAMGSLHEDDGLVARVEIHGTT